MIPNTSQEELERYSENISDQESPLLKALARETHQKVLRPRMISGHLQGRLLSLLSKLIRPQNILEIGTYTGYSALCLAEGLLPEGKLHTIDKNEELYDLQRKYFDQSEWSDQLIQHTGDALSIIPEIKETFDLVFLDADKKNYSNYFDLVYPKLNQGGLLISDNVLWYGKVIKPTKKGDHDTALLKEFNQKLSNHEGLENILLPIRDGILVSRKK